MDDTYSQKYVDFELKLPEKRLIELTRSMESGKIEAIKIQDGLPVLYRMSLKTKKFCD